MRSHVIKIDLLPGNRTTQWGRSDYESRETSGTIIVDTAHTYFYYILGGGKAMPYGVGVCRKGFT